MKLKNKTLIFVLLLSLLLSSAVSGQGSDKITLAVMDFKNNTSVIRYDRLQRALADMLKTELSYYSEISVLERSKIESILAEQALAQAGVIEEKQAQEVGRLAGAEYIITGEINTTRGLLRIDAHIIKVATGQILGEKVTGKDEDCIEPMIKLLANNLIFDLTGAGERKEFKKISQYYSNWALISTGALAATTTILHFVYKSNYDKYHTTDRLDKFDYYYDKANRNYKARNIMLAITGAAAITTFILWQNDRSEKNKIYTLNDKLFSKPIPGQLALGFAATGEDCLLFLNFHF